LRGRLKRIRKIIIGFIVTDKGKLLGLVMMKDFYSAMDNIRAELRKPLKEADM